MVGGASEDEMKVEFVSASMINSHNNNVLSAR